MTTVDSPAVTSSVPGSPRWSLGGYLRDYLRRLRGGETGSLPAVLGLIALCVIFGVAKPVFFSAGNFANLFNQGAAVAIIAIGLTFVLLLGEIDLSAGFTSGVCATIMAVLLTEHGVPWYLAVPTAVATGVVIGLILGNLVVKVQIPSFVVTLAAFLTLQGVQLLFLSGGKNISITDNTIVAINNNNMKPWVGWLMLVLAVGGFAVVQVFDARRRTAKGLAAAPLSIIALQVGALAVIGGAAIFILNRERSNNPPHRVGNLILGHSLKGVPIIVAVIAIALVLWTFVLSRTAYGRHVYAVGGNREAARRAGINVDRIRVSAFVICSSMAAIGGIATASRLSSVDSNTGGSNVLLYAVGAAVIGGTSLFGGRGRIINAVIGGAVVAVIDNGMGLLGASSSTKFIVTGMFLLLAAGVDALSRRRAAATGLR